MNTIRGDALHRCRQSGHRRDGRIVREWLERSDPVDQHPVRQLEETLPPVLHCPLVEPGRIIVNRHRDPAFLPIGQGCSSGLADEVEHRVVDGCPQVVNGLAEQHRHQRGMLRMPRATTSSFSGPTQVSSKSRGPRPSGPFDHSKDSVAKSNIS